MSRVLLARALGWALVTAFVVWQTPLGTAWAQAAEDPGSESARKSQARALAKQAGALLNEKKFDEALAVLREAEEKYHAPIHLLWIGEALEGLGRLAEALESYRTLKEEQLAPDAPPVFTTAQTDAIERFTRLKKVVPVLLVEVSPATDLRATLDSRPFDSLNEAKRVDAGTYVLRLEAKGYKPFEQEVTLTPDGSVETVEVELVALPAEVPVPPPPPPQDDADGPDVMFIAGLSTLAVGGANLLIGAITGGMAFSRVGELEDRCDLDLCIRADESLIDEATTLGNVSTAGFIVGGVGTAVGAALLFVPLFRGDAAPQSSAIVEPWSAGDSAGLRLRF